MNAIEYLKQRKYSIPTEMRYDEEAGILDLWWRNNDETWAVLEVGKNTNSDFSFCAKGPGGSIKMKGACTIANLDAVIDFAIALLV